MVGWKEPATVGAVPDSIYLRLQLVAMPFSEYASILPVRVEVPLRSAPSIWARRSRLRSSTRIESEKDISCLQFSDDLLIFHVRISYWWRILGRHLRVVIRDRDDVAFEKKNNKKLENWPLMTT